LITFAAGPYANDKRLKPAERLRSGEPHSVAIPMNLSKSLRPTSPPRPDRPGGITRPKPDAPGPAAEITRT
jgi:hypothetical protein